MDLMVAKSLVEEKIESILASVPKGAPDSSQLAELARDEERAALRSTLAVDAHALSEKVLTLRRLQGALARIQNGTYGICGMCHEEIEEARLQALPETVKCSQCAKATDTHNPGPRRPFAKGFPPPKERKLW